MVNYACAFSQSEFGKYFEGIIISVIINIIVCVSRLKPLTPNRSEIVKRSNSKLILATQSFNRKSTSSCKMLQALRFHAIFPF